MEHLRSEPFQLGSGIGRSRSVNPAASFDESRDDADCAAADPTQFRKPSLLLQPPPSTGTNMAAVSEKFHQLVVKNNDAYGDHSNNISRTISQDTAETSALSIASELTAGTAYTSNTTNTDATLDAAIATSRDGGHAHALLELSTIEEDSAAGTGGNGGASTAKGITDTPGGKSNAATAGVNDNDDVEAAEKNSKTNHGDQAMKMDLSADVRSSFPSFLSTLPPTWSGTSLDRKSVV